MLKATLQIGLVRYLLLKKLKNTVSRAYIISDYSSEEIVGTFYQTKIAKYKPNGV